MPQSYSKKKFFFPYSPVVTFIIAAMLSGAASLFLCEALSAIPENNKFQVRFKILHFSLNIKLILIMTS
jgi:hypothetical protein